MRLCFFKVLKHHSCQTASSTPEAMYLKLLWYTTANTVHFACVTFLIIPIIVTLTRKLCEEHVCANGRKYTLVAPSPNEILGTSLGALRAWKIYCPFAIDVHPRSDLLHS